MENMQTYKLLEFLVILLSSCIVMVSGRSLAGFRMYSQVHLQHVFMKDLSR